MTGPRSQPATYPASVMAMTNSSAWSLWNWSGISEDTDKNGNWFLTGIKLEILEPEEWRGRSIYANYICIPQSAGPSASLSERRKSEENGVALGRFIKAFKIPYDAEGVDPADAIGCEGDVSARNEEYQGRKIPRVQDFLL